MEWPKFVEIIFKITLGISGWISLFYLIYSNRPKIKGELLFCMRGLFKSVGNDKNKTYTGYLLYPLLTNKGKKPIFIINYELEIDFGNGYQRMQKAYGLDNSRKYSFENIEIPNFTNQLIYNKNSLIKYGNALHGFLVFGIEDISYASKKTFKYKLTCIDAFHKKHVIEQFSDHINQRQIFINLSGSRFKE